jgi:hypothetical protein
MTALEMAGPAWELAALAVLLAGGRSTWKWVRGRG